MKTIIIIPTRMKSQRLPGKALYELEGASGERRSLTERCYIAASQVQADGLFVATDHEDIANHVKDFGGEVIMTPESCQNGTERCASLLDQIDADLIINFQGDAPLIPVDFVEALIDHMKSNPHTDVATPVLACDHDRLHALRQDRLAGRVGGTTASFNDQFRALYFSKEVIPISDELIKNDPSAVYLHVGLYAFRREALAQYSRWPIGRLEKIEGLEQLRFLENGKHVDCVEVEANGRAFWELNLTEDVARVEDALKQRGIE